jgi:hypothetical protein
MAVVAPFLLALGLGVFEFGNALYRYHLISTGIRDAGRYLAGLPERDEAAREKGKNIAVTGLPAGDELRISWWDADDISVWYCIDGAQEGDASPDCACDGDLDLRHGTTNKVCVSTTVAYGDLGLLGYYGLGSIIFSTNHEERYFGVR